MKTHAVAALLFLTGASAFAGDAVRAEIDHLLTYVASADVAFIRNRKEHTAREAVEHMKKKADHFKEKIRTAEDFIAYAGTKSLLSGQIYTVRLDDGKIMPCADWLKKELARFRARQEGEAAKQAE